MFSKLQRNVHVRNISGLRGKTGPKDITRKIDGRDWFFPADGSKGPVDPKTGKVVLMPLEAARWAVRKVGTSKLEIMRDTVTIADNEGVWVYHTVTDGPWTLKYDGQTEEVEPFTRYCFPKNAAKHFIRKQSVRRSKKTGEREEVLFRAPAPFEGEFVFGPEMTASQIRKYSKPLLNRGKKSEWDNERFVGEMNHLLWQAGGMSIEAADAKVKEADEGSES